MRSIYDARLGDKFKNYRGCVALPHGWPDMIFLFEKDPRERCLHLARLRRDSATRLLENV